MRYTIVVDNNCQNTSLLTEWGFSGLLDISGKRVLLDTAQRGMVLLHNLKALDIEPASIDHLVLSHGHYDHCGGLPDLLQECPALEIWASPHIQTPRFKGETAHTTHSNGGAVFANTSRFSPIVGKTKISEKIWAFDIPASVRSPQFVYTHQLWEQGAHGQCCTDTFADDVSLLVEGEHGLSLILGCAHAGLPNIMRYIHESLGVRELYAVVGGTHMCHLDASTLDLWHEALRVVPVRLWRPNHCTGFLSAAKLAQAFDDVLWAGAGYSMEL